MATCQTCKGKGYRYSAPYFVPRIWEHMRMVQCPTCRGTGSTGSDEQAAHEASVLPQNQ